MAVVFSPLRASNAFTTAHFFADLVLRIDLRGLLGVFLRLQLRRESLLILHGHLFRL